MRYEMTIVYVDGFARSNAVPDGAGGPTTEVAKAKALRPGRRRGKEWTWEKWGISSKSVGTRRECIWEAGI